MVRVFQCGSRPGLSVTYHIPWPQVKLFGNPFLIKVGLKERLAHIKARIQAKLKPRPEDFNTWDWSWHIYLASPEKLEDEDTLESRLKRHSSAGLHCDFLGIEHADSGPRRKFRRQDSSRCVPRVYK